MLGRQADLRAEIRKALSRSLDSEDSESSLATDTEECEVIVRSLNSDSLVSDTTGSSWESTPVNEVDTSLAIHDLFSFQTHKTSVKLESATQDSSGPQRQAKCDLRPKNSTKKSEGKNETAHCSPPSSVPVRILNVIHVFVQKSVSTRYVHVLCVVSKSNACRNQKNVKSKSQCQYVLNCKHAFITLLPW